MELTCIVCPLGCHLAITNNTVTGNRCKRGERYALEEIVHPKRMLTTTIKINSHIQRRCPVMSTKPIPKERLFDVMKELRNVEIKVPCNVGDVVIENVCNTGSTMVVTKTFIE